MQIDFSPIFSLIVNSQIPTYGLIQWNDNIVRENSGKHLKWFNIALNSNRIINDYQMFEKPECYFRKDFAQLYCCGGGVRNIYLSPMIKVWHVLGLFSGFSQQHHIQILKGYIKHIK